MSRKLFLLIALLLALAACGKDKASSDKPKPTSEPTRMPIVLEQTETAVLLALTPSSTSTPTFTPTNTPLPSSTPLPATPAPQLTVLPPTTYYAVTGANLRSCPHISTACAPVGELAAGDWLSVIGQLTGDAISGNALWYQAGYDGMVVYVHSSVLTPAKPAFGPVVQSTIPPPQPQTARDPYGCNGINDLDCEDFNKLGMNANAHLAQCGDEDHLDGDDDGRACEDW